MGINRRQRRSFERRVAHVQIMLGKFVEETRLFLTEQKEMDKDDVECQTEMFDISQAEYVERYIHHKNNEWIALCKRELKGGKISVIIPEYINCVAELKKFIYGDSK